MSSIVTIFLVIGAGFLLSIVYLIFKLVHAASRARGARAVVCPETLTPESVEVGGLRTAWTTVAGDPQLHLTSCSRWPEHRDCGQKCLTQIEAASDGCLVRTRVEHWYEGSLCGLCGKQISEVRLSPRSAVATPEGRIRRWVDLTIPDLPDVLANDKPVCPTCQENPPRRTAQEKTRRAGSAA